MSAGDEMDKVDEIYALVRENNSMLRSMRMNARVGGLLKLVFWVVLLVVIPYFIWQHFQPYVDQASQTYQSVQTQAQSAEKSLSGVAEAASSTQSLFGDVRKAFGF